MNNMRILDDFRLGANTSEFPNFEGAGIFTDYCVGQDNWHQSKYLINFSYFTEDKNYVVQIGNDANYEYYRWYSKQTKTFSSMLLSPTSNYLVSCTSGSDKSIYVLENIASRSFLCKYSASYPMPTEITEIEFNLDTTIYYLRITYDYINDKIIAIGQKPSSVSGVNTCKYYYSIINPDCSINVANVDTGMVTTDANKYLYITADNKLVLIGKRESYFYDLSNQSMIQQSNFTTDTYFIDYGFTNRPVAYNEYNQCLYLSTAIGVSSNYNINITKQDFKTRDLIWTHQVYSNTTMYLIQVMAFLNDYIFVSDGANFKIFTDEGVIINSYNYILSTYYTNDNPYHDHLIPTILDTDLRFVIQNK